MAGQMAAKLVKPKNDEQWLAMRAKNINSTESAALFHLSPWVTEWELWHRKASGMVITLEENTRMKWGKRLQNAIGMGMAEDMGWKIRPMPEYAAIEKLRIGSSFDFEIIVDGEKAILETKNVDGLAFRDGWAIDDDGSVEAPPHIELQVQHQMLVLGLKVAYIGALVGGNNAVPIKRVADPKVQDLILEKVDGFWTSIKNKVEPKPDFARDAAFIRQLYSQSVDGKVVDMSTDENLKALVKRHQEAAELEKKGKEEKDSLKAQMVMVIGDAAKVLGDGFSISAGTVAETVVPAYTRKGYRNVRVYEKKEKVGK